MSLIQLYPYQQRWLADRQRFKLGMFARQTGKTFTTALELVEHCLDAVARGVRCRWVILSRGERQAKEAIDEGVALHAKNYKAAIQASDYDWKSPDGFSFKAQEVTFAPNVRVTALPANPDTARGFSANVFLDEFAFHANSKAIWTALFPVISNGEQLLRVVSTPNGKGNKFYELVTGKDAIWSRHIVDIYQAVRDGLPRDIEQLRAALNDDDAWAQEFELQWLDEASAWLSYELISSCEHEDAGRPELYQGGDVYIGNDIGVRRDLWVGWALEDIGDRLVTREIRTLRRKSFADQDRALDEMVDTYNVRRIAMDQTGMGEKPVEDAKRRYGESRVEGVLFSAPRKTVLATVGKQAFEDRKIEIPMGDPQIRADLHKLRRVVGPTGNARFLADSDADGHADRAWACFLAVAAAAHPSAPIEFEAIEPPAEPYDGFGSTIARAAYRGF